MEYYRTNEQTPRELVLITSNHDEDEVTYVDMTNLKFMHAPHAEWVNTIHEIESEYVDGLFSLKLDWGMNDMSTNDAGARIRRQLNQILSENGIANLQRNEKDNFDITPEIETYQIEKVLLSGKLAGIIEAMRVYNLELIVF